MNFSSLPLEILVEVFLFLSPLEIVKLQRLCRAFDDCIQKSDRLLHNNFLKAFQLQPLQNMLSWKKILKRIQLGHVKLNLFFPYFTNGGTKADTSKYFIHNLITRFSMYSTVRGENVLVKYAYINQLNYNYSNPLRYKISEDIFYVEEIEMLSDLPQKKVPFIEKIIVGFPKLRHNPLTHAVLFYSFEKVLDEEVISMFHSCKSKHKAVSKGKKLGLVCTYQKTKFSTIVFYKKCSLDIKPMCWVRFKHDYFVQLENVTIRLPKGVFAKYFYLLLIDGGDRQNANIDTAYLSPIGKEVTLIHS